MTSMVAESTGQKELRSLSYWEIIMFYRLGVMWWEVYRSGMLLSSCYQFFLSSWAAFVLQKPASSWAWLFCLWRSKNVEPSGLGLSELVSPLALHFSFHLRFLPVFHRKGEKVSSVASSCWKGVLIRGWGRWKESRGIRRSIRPEWSWPIFFMIDLIVLSQAQPLGPAVYFWYPLLLVFHVSMILSSVLAIDQSSEGT